MGRRTTYGGWLYAVGVLARAGSKDGMSGYRDRGEDLAALKALRDHDRIDVVPRDAAHILLTAAEVLVEAADKVSEDLRGNSGDILCSLDFEDARRFLDDDDGDE